MKPQKTYFIILLLFIFRSCNTNKKEKKEVLQETVKAVKKHRRPTILENI